MSTLAITTTLHAMAWFTRVALYQEGAHARGYNKYSIGICYESGLDENGLPTDTRTPEQRICLKLLLERLAIDYPHARVVGHNQLNSNKACPCFDI